METSLVGDHFARPKGASEAAVSGGLGWERRVVGGRARKDSAAEAGEKERTSPPKKQQAQPATHKVLL